MAHRTATDSASSTRDTTHATQTLAAAHTVVHFDLTRIRSAPLDELAGGVLVNTTSPQAIAQAKDVVVDDLAASDDGQDALSDAVTDELDITEVLSSESTRSRRASENPFHSHNLEERESARRSTVDEPPNLQAVTQYIRSAFGDDFADVLAGCWTRALHLLAFIKGVVQIIGAQLARLCVHLRLRRPGMYACEGAMAALLFFCLSVGITEGESFKFYAALFGALVFGYAAHILSKNPVP